MSTTSTARTTRCSWRTILSSIAAAAPLSDTARLSPQPASHIQQGGRPKPLGSLIAGYTGQYLTDPGVSVLPENSSYRLSSHKSFWSSCSRIHHVFNLQEFNVTHSFRTKHLNGRGRKQRLIPQLSMWFDFAFLWVGLSSGGPLLLGAFCAAVHY